MSLPARQRRVLARMESGLRADEPQLASMYGIFAQLASGEPVRTERLAASRWPWRRPPGPALYAVVLFPVIFSLVAVGALLSGGAHAVRTCAVGYSVGGGTSLPNRPQCQAPVAGSPVAGLPAAGAKTAGSKAAADPSAACLRYAELISPSSIRANGDLAFPPSAGSPAAPGAGPEMCYK